LIAYTRFSVLLLSAAFILTLSCGGSDEGTPPTQQTFGSLAGKAFLANTRATLSDVIVTVAGFTDTTDEFGSYQFLKLPNGNHVIKGTRDEYNLLDDVVIISGSSTYNLQMKIAITGAVVRGMVSHPGTGQLVSSAWVIIESDSVRSNSSGEFEMFDAPVGGQILTCRHSDYHLFSDSIFVTSSQTEYNIGLIRTDVNSVLVTQDATIEFKSFDASASKRNLGFEPRLEVVQLVEPNKWQKSRVLVSLPHPPEGVKPSELDSASFSIKVTFSGTAADADWTGETIIARMVESDWSETTVTWNSAPKADTLPVATSLENNGGYYVTMDMLDYYKDPEFNPTHGVLLLLESDFENGSPSTPDILRFWSSEWPDPSVSPRVTFKYTR